MLAQQIIQDFEAILNSKSCPTCQKTCTNQCVDCLNYYSQHPMDYSCENLRYAYVLRYFFASKAEIKKALRRYSSYIIDHLSLRNRVGDTTFIGIGLGPGSDFTAFTEWAAETSINNLNMLVVRVDNEDNWSNQYKLINRIYKDVRESINMKTDGRKKIGDGLTSDISAYAPDFISISYFLSEYLKGQQIQQIKNNIDIFVDQLNRIIGDKCVIILNDRPQQEIATLFNYFSQKILQFFPNTSIRTDCFKEGYGTLISFDRMCESSFDDQFRTKYKTRRWCDSFQCILFIQR